jgi:hypothetical protein
MLGRSTIRAVEPNHSRRDAPDYGRAGAIGKHFQDPADPRLAELLIDAEEDPRVRAVLIPMLREAER